MTTSQNPPFRYPLDPTGQSTNNLVVGEIHTLVNRTVRAVAPLYGSFFSTSVIITDMATNLPLRGPTNANPQWKSSEMFEFLTGRYGQEICGIILITDVLVSSNISIQYQTVGGEYSTNSDAIIAMLNSAQLDNRPVAWDDIISKPAAFVPAFHYHDIGDIYGFEYVVHALERLRQAVLMGDTVSQDAIYRYIDAAVSTWNAAITSTNSQLTAHVNNISNPHQTTATQVGLGNVANYATATTVQAQTGTANNLYMTPFLVSAAITTLALTPLNAHINNYSNPHNTTSAQVGLGSVQNYGVAAQIDATTGTSNILYMTPLRTFQAIGAQLSATGLTAHLSDHANPHFTTAAQVGLGNVQNFALAATADAQAGTSNLLYMTPYLTAQAITAQALGPLNTHVTNTNNPHSTTAAQVGLGSVLNYGVATQSDALTGTSNILYMTPLRVAQAIQAGTGSALSAHLVDYTNPHHTTAAQVGLGNVLNYGVAVIADVAAASSSTLYVTPYAMSAVTLGHNSHVANTSNPHSTTAAQVGLGSVSNFGLAAQSDATSGTSNTLYMTPLRTAQAIAALGITGWYTGSIAAPGNDANTMLGSKSGFTYSNNAPYTGPIVRFDAGGYDLEINAPYAGTNLAFRTRNGDSASWNSWKTMANSDGTNASGSWPINISGGAASATTAAKAAGVIRGDNASLTWAYNHNASIFTVQPSWLMMTNDGATAGPYNPASLSVGNATTSGTATVANTLKFQGAGNATFNWSGQSGQPTYLWGGVDPSNMYVYNPLNFHVSVADTATSAPNYLPLSGGSISGSVSVSNTLSAGAIVSSSSVTTSNEWFRSTGSTGWFNNTYAGGIYMTDTTWVRIYNDKGFITGGTIQGGALVSTGTGSFSGLVTASDFQMTSDRRVKMSITPVADARRRFLDTVHGVTYVRDGKNEMGVVAQDVEKEFPIAVHDGDELYVDGTPLKKVSYNALWAPTVETLRDMDKQLNEQAETIRLQGDLIARLMARLDKLEKAE